VAQVEAHVASDHPDLYLRAGADAVICHHTHVPSGMEVVNGVPIVYGTGNFLFDSPRTRPASWYIGYMVSLEVLNNTVTTIELIPYVQCLDTVGVQLLHGKAATEFLQEILKLSTLIQDQTAITQAWQSFCEARRSEYLARLIASNWLEEQLWARQLLPQWLIRRRTPNWLGLIRCQAHHEVLSEILQRSVDEMT
jgi:poly-gamma-glutamate synthesis protein (capsule biosynthesis protein)